MPNNRHTALQKLCFLVICIILTVTGCSKEHYRQDADREAYDIIDSKWDERFGPQANYRINDVEPGPNDIVAETVAPVGALTLADAVQLAILNNRDYQSRKEDLYLQALSLSLTRHSFAPQFFGLIGVDYDVGQGGDSIGANTSFGFSQLLADGAVVSASIANSWLEFLTGEESITFGSVLRGSVVQPLLRGAGRDIVQETLTQAERDMLYEMRDFARYRKRFVVSIISEYYRVLQGLDAIQNAENDYERRQESLKREQMLYDAGRKPLFEIDQTRQALLEAEDRVVRARQSYEQLLDNFKITLAMAPDSDLQLDPRELEVLQQMDLSEPDYAVEDAIETALAERLDLANSHDQVYDAERAIKVAEDDLQISLDVYVSSNVDSQGPRQFADLEFDEGAYSMGLDADLDLDRKRERNAYRRSLIQFQRQERAYGLARDNVKLDVREAYRDLRQAAAQYKIRDESLVLAERRVESTELLLQAGRIITRDLLEAQAALISAQNSRTDALVRYTIATLSFYRDIGILDVKADGSWEQRNP